MHNHQGMSENEYKQWEARENKGAQGSVQTSASHNTKTCSVSCTKFSQRCVTRGRQHVQVPCRNDEERERTSANSGGRERTSSARIGVNRRVAQYRDMFSFVHKIQSMTRHTWASTRASFVQKRRRTRENEPGKDTAQAGQRTQTIAMTRTHPVCASVQIIGRIVLRT